MNGISSLVTAGPGEVDVAGEIHSLGVLARQEREGAELAGLAFQGGLSSPGFHLGAHKYPTDISP